MIVVFGSINLDLIFRLHDLPAPGETRLADDFGAEPGGKGANQAMAAARDGAPVALYGAVGRDGFARQALSGLRAAGVDLDGVVEVDAPTGVASIMTDARGRNSIAVAAGANLFARDDLVPDHRLRAAVALAQMECDPGRTCAFIERAHALGARVILNLAPAAALPEATLRSLHMIVVNESEADFLGAQFSVASTAAALARRLGPCVVRTLGERGCEASSGEATIAIPARSVVAIDTTAAGDCFVGVLAAALDRGLDLRSALQRANVAAALACTRRGSQSSLPFAKEIDAACS